MFSGVIACVCVCLLDDKTKKLTTPEQIYQQLYEAWFSAINAWFRHILNANWMLDDEQKVDQHSWNLVIANHQSWADVFVVLRKFKAECPYQKSL